MHLAPRDLDKLVLHGAGFLAQKRLARGLRLNYPEAVALIATQLLELIRDGRAVAELMDVGPPHARARHVMDGVAEMIVEVQVEGTFPDGTKLVTVHRPDRRSSAATSRSRSTAASCPCRPSAALPGRSADGVAAARRGPRRARRRSRSTTGATSIEIVVKSVGDRPDPGRQPLPVRRDEPRARLRSRARARACASTSPPARRCASSRATRRPCASSPPRRRRRRRARR